MQVITERTRIKTILGDSILKKYENIVFPHSAKKMKWLRLMSLGTFFKIFNYQESSSIISGLNRLKEIGQLENQLHYVYSQQEVKNDQSKGEVTLTYFPSMTDERKPFVLLCAGGGYQTVCSIVEGYPIAEKLNELGYAVFVLNYRTKNDARYPNVIDDIAMSVKWIIAHSVKFNIKIEDYAIGGFSAGGHMVACFGTETVGYPNYNLPSPGALFLSYPVISMGEYTHKETQKYFLRDNKHKKNYQDKYSVEKQVNKNYPPTYIWTFDNDDCVNSKNSKLLVQSLKKNCIPYSFHTVEGVSHGVGLGTGTKADGWLEEAVAFWEQQIK